MEVNDHSPLNPGEVVVVLSEEIEDIPCIMTKSSRRGWKLESDTDRVASRRQGFGVFPRYHQLERLCIRKTVDEAFRYLLAVFKDIKNQFFRRVMTVRPNRDRIGLLKCAEVEPQVPDVVAAGKLGILPSVAVDGHPLVANDVPPGPLVPPPERAVAADQVVAHQDVALGVPGDAEPRLLRDEAGRLQEGLACLVADVVHWREPRIDAQPVLVGIDPLCVDMVYNMVFLIEFDSLLVFDYVFFVNETLGVHYMRLFHHIVPDLPSDLGGQA
ncbi:hypothetical protein PG985_009690 [Apiospora marii]|uniref:uncharacterized protein n=1 Tax=Apiospora marii TaxID=335849 RepID=UPI00312CCA6F